MGQLISSYHNINIISHFSNNVMVPLVLLLATCVAVNGQNSFANFPASTQRLNSGRQVRLPAATSAVPQPQQQPQRQFVFNPQQQVNAQRVPQQVVRQQPQVVRQQPQQFQAVAPQQQPQRFQVVQQQPQFQAVPQQQLQQAAPQPVQNNFQFSTNFGQQQPQQQFVNPQQFAPAPQRFVPQQQPAAVPQRVVPRPAAVPQRAVPRPAAVPQQQQPLAVPEIPEPAVVAGEDGQDGGYVHDPSGDATLSRFELFKQRKAAEASG